MDKATALIKSYNVVMLPTGSSSSDFKSTGQIEANVCYSDNFTTIHMDKIAYNNLN